jgi:hypothetical protein
MVGGPGFEPGASRSRNLGYLVHEIGLEGSEFISSVRLTISGRFHPLVSRGLLHEVLHD